MSDANELKAKGNAEFSAGNYTASIDTFTAALALDPENHVLYSNRSGAFVAVGDFAKAKADAEACIAKKPDWFKSYSRLGAALHGLKQYDEATAQYEKSLAMASGADVAKIQSSLDDVRKDKEISSRPARPARAGGDDADEAFDTANPFGKIFGPDSLAKIAANPKTAHFLLKPGFEQKIRTLMANPALLNSMMQDRDVMMCALQMMGIGDQFNPDDVPSKSSSSSAAPPKSSSSAQPSSSSKPAPKPAAAAAAAAAELTPAQQAKEEGNKLYLARKFDEALAKYDEAFSLDDKNTTYLLNRTAVLFEQGKFEEVLEASDKAVEHAREHKADWAVLGKIMTRKASALQKLNRHTEAIALFNQALLEHRNAETLNRLHACEAEKKRLDEEAYLDSELAVKAKEEGNELYKQGKYPEALKCYEEAIKRNPKDHIPYSNRAGTLLKLGVCEEAIKDCDKCLAICPTFVRAYARKAQAYLLTKQLHRALTTYDEGLKHDPENQECKEGRMKVIVKIQEVSSSEGNEEVAQRAMQDPEIQAIMSDSYIQMVLKECGANPERLRDYMKDARIAASINKLIAAGILRVK